MPRVAANAKKEDLPMKFTSITVPFAMNPKIGGSSYLKSDTSTIWGRKAKAKDSENQEPPPPRKGSNVIVIHPGSRFLRMGRACDPNPITISHVIARRQNTPVNPPTVYPRVHTSHEEKENMGPAIKAVSDDGYTITVATDDPVDRKIASIATSLRDRMRFYKLPVAKGASETAIEYNKNVEPEEISEEDDQTKIHWVTTPPTSEVVIGERVFRMVDPHAMGYIVRWPIHGNRLNTRQYSSLPDLMGDIEAIWVTVLREGLKIDKKTFKDYSVVLVVPDFFNRQYLREMCYLILVTMGFKQMCVQQESISATFGAGLSNACVIDIGATKTSIACVDEGVVIADSRMLLSMGGDDITEFLSNLLKRIKFPHKDLQLSRPYDWQVMEDLKSRLCTLAEGDVSENIYELIVRASNRPTLKYTFRAYDEIILAPMCIFEPKVINFDGKSQGLRSVHHPLVEEIIEHPGDYATQAMIISTQHLLPPSALAPPSVLTTPAIPAPGNTIDQPVFAVEPQPPQGDPEPTTATLQIPDSKSEDKDDSMNVDGEKESKDEPQKSELDTPADVAEPDQAQQPTAEANTNMETEQPPVSPVVRPLFDATFSYPGGFPIDVEFESSKLPLDVAVFNSARAAGGDEKIRKYLQAVLVIGGSSLIAGMDHALESRLQAIATPLVDKMEKVQILPPPKDVDPRILAWKGAGVLAKLDSVNDLWVSGSDWDKLELRAIRERCFFF